MKGDNPAVVATRKALRPLLENTSQSKWAKLNVKGMSADSAKSAVNDLMRGASISPERLNPIRSALGMDDIEERDVTINQAQQVIAAPGYGRKRSPRFEFRCTEEEAAKIRAYMEYYEIESFTELCKKAFHLEKYTPTDWGEHND